jgi:predicted hotdog family 3-hydroxylacyl-ACP dehydratase
MSCRRICRELLWLARFGELGPSSAPHLDHLADCRACRDEVGFDRALVQQLRLALAERIEHAAPSPAAWGAILMRAQEPERGVRGFLQGRAAALASRLRTATAITAVALAGIIATSTHVAITHPEAGSAETEVLTSTAGELYERQPLLQRAAQADPRVPVIYVPTGPPSDAEDAFLVSASLAGSEPAPAAAEETLESPETESSIESIVSLGGTASRVTPVDPANGGVAESAGSEEATNDGAAAGEPY